MHVASADRPYQDAVATVSLGEHHEHVSLLRCGSNRTKPPLALGILLIGQDNNGSVKQAFNLSDRDSVVLALLAVARIPIKTRKIHVRPLGRQLVSVEAFVNTNPVAYARPAIRRAQPAELEIEKLFVITPQKCVGKALSNDHRDIPASGMKSPGGNDERSILSRHQGYSGCRPGVSDEEGRNSYSGSVTIA
jgi:hypothetical protein